MRILFGAAALTAAHCFWSVPPAWAEDVTLRSRTGGLAVTGSLLGYDGETYRVETAWGQMTVEAEAVDCEGPGCPGLGRMSADLRLAVEPWLAEALLLPRLHHYAEAEGLDLLHLPDEEMIELSRAGRPELRLHLMAAKGAPEALLAAGAAEAALSLASPDSRFRSRLIGWIPLTLVSGPEAPMGRLPLSQLPQARKTGADWGALGLEARPLVWHDLAAGGVLARAADLVFGPGEAETRRAADLSSLQGALGRDPWGLALLPRALVKEGGLVERSLSAACGFAIDRSALAIASGDDPLSLPIHWIEAGPRLPAAVRRLAAYLRSAPEAPPGIGGPAISLAMAPVPLSAMPERLFNSGLDPNPELDAAARRTALIQLGAAARLPHTFRPGDGEAALEDLAARLATGLAEGAEVLLVGFADAAGSAAEAQTDSLNRAEALRARLSEELPEANGLQITALGLGEALPLRCAESPEATRLNRRVEVWLRPLSPTAADQR